MHSSQRFVDQNQKKGDGNSLGGNRNKGGHRAGSTVIDIRCPHVKGKKGQFEADGGKGKEHAQPEQWVLRMSGAGLAQGLKGQGTGSSVEKGIAKEEQTGGSGPHDDVLGGCFHGQIVLFIKTTQDIKRDCGQFHADKQGQQVSGRDHHKHAKGTEQENKEKLAAVFQYTSLVATGCKIGP